jgi:hypothetical protein
VGEHIIDRGHRLGQSLVGRHLRVQRRGRAVHGFFRGKHGGQFLVRHVNKGEGFLRRLQGFRRHRRDFLAHKQHPVPRQNRDIAQQPAHSAVGEVLASEDRMDARDLAGPGGIDAQNMRVGIGTAQDFPPQHAGQQQVGSIQGLTGHLLRPFLLGYWLAYGRKGRSHRSPVTV